MPGDYVETMRRANEAFVRGDKATWLSCIARDAVMIPAREWPESAPIRGAEAIWDFYVEVTSAWEAGSSDFGEAIEVRDDTVVLNSLNAARGRASGAAVPFSYWMVITFRDGKQVRHEWFSDRAEALVAAGASN